MVADGGAAAIQPPVAEGVFTRARINVSAVHPFDELWHDEAVLCIRFYNDV